MERFGCGTLVVAGDGAMEELGRQSCGRLLVVSEPGEDRELERIIGAGQTEHLQFMGRASTMRQAVEGSRRIREFRPELVAVVGDGPVLDCGKAMVGFSRVCCRLVVIPTDFNGGTGVTDRVSLTHDGRYHLLRDASMRPGITILADSRVTRTKRMVLRESGFSLLAEALEAYTMKEQGLLSELHAREAFVSAWAALPAASAGRTEACRRMQRASVLAGLAVDQTGLGLCRAMENSLGMVYGLSRGKAAAMLLPVILSCNAHAAGRRYAELSRAAGLGGSNDGTGVRNLRAGLLRLRRELELPGTLAQAGVDIRRVWNDGRRIVELTLEDPECRNNPVAVDDYLVRRILEAITGQF